MRLTSLRSRLKARKEELARAREFIGERIQKTEELAAEVVFLREAAKVHLVMLKELAAQPITEGLDVEINALADATAEAMGVSLGT
jgi:hypothetical protein